MKWNWSVIFQQVCLTQSDEQTNSKTGYYRSMMVCVSYDEIFLSWLPVRCSIVGFSGWVAQSCPSMATIRRWLLQFTSIYDLSFQSLTTHGHTQCLIHSHSRAFPDHLLMTSFARSRSCLACNSSRAFRSLAESNLHPSPNHVRKRNASSTKRTNIIQLLCHPQLLKNEISHDFSNSCCACVYVCVASWSYTVKSGISQWFKMIYCFYHMFNKKSLSIWSWFSQLNRHNKAWVGHFRTCLAPFRWTACIWFRFGHPAGVSSQKLGIKSIKSLVEITCDSSYP